MAKADLRQAMRDLGTHRQPEPVRELPTPIDRAGDPNFRASREGKAQVSGYYPREVRKQLRGMAAESETTIEDLLAEALNDLFAKYQKPEIAPRKEKK